MKLHPLCVTLLLVSASIASAQTSDFPGAVDLSVVKRPANSFIIGATHIDNDEYDVPLGPVERNATQLGKTIRVTGAIDTLAYAGPTTASSLTTYTGLSMQLLAAGYTEAWSCARKTCGAAFYLANILDKPMIDSIHKGDWGFWLNDDLNATNDDIRLGAFKKGVEYRLIMASLAPGHPSGALLVRINGPANQSVLQSSPDAAQEKGEPIADASASPSGSTSDAPANAPPRRGRLRAKAEALLKQAVPQHPAGPGGGAGSLAQCRSSDTERVPSDPRLHL